MTNANAVFTPSRMVRDLERYFSRPSAPPGASLISLASGDPDFATPEHISQALAEAIAAGATHYAPAQGDPELREALGEQLTEIAGRTLGPEHVVVTHGGSAGLASAILSVVGPGDRVIIPEPTYSYYAELTAMAGGEAVFVAHRPDMHLDLEGIEAAAPGARLAVICNPCNPTGAVYTRRELEGLAAIAERHGLLVMADEAYDHIVYDGVDFYSTLEIPRLAERLIYVNTFSKTYAMTGWRVGYVAASPEVVTAATAVHRAFNGVLNSAVMQAALVALTERSDAPQRMRREYQARREIITRMLANVPGLEMQEPEGAFYAFIRYASSVPSVEVVRRGYDQGVAVRAGLEFGPSGEHHVRVAFSTSRERLIEGMERLLSLLEEIAD